ncbi:MAG TPA: FAD-dependent oxidoreductase [Thermoanaerobaculia bacterium]|nr:FAD-dependent oxidoreductase [Thermoanaerobaculia bacterium]
MKPVILVADDDPKSLASLSEALTRRYGADYRVVSAASGPAGLEELGRIREGGEKVALLIADQWMPEMPGLEFMTRAHVIHPAAQRALLVDWGDQTAAPAILRGCAFGQLENYIRKPWSPPEVHLYPAIGEFLAAWTRAHGPRMELVRVVGEDASRRTHEVRMFLDRSGIPHGFYEAGSEEGLAVLRGVGVEVPRLPVVILLDGRALMDPTSKEISDALGATNLAEERDFDLAIVGAGPAGLAAAVYGASEGLETIVIERESVGGQAGTSPMIRNYLGFPRGISGGELAQRAYEQAWLFGTKFVFAREGLKLRGGRKLHLTLADGIEITARAVIIATGASYRRLGVPGEDRLAGAGIFYATPSDARVLKGQHLFVAGGGNAAGQAVLFLAEYAKQVTLLVRGETLEASMSSYLIHQIGHTPNVEVRLQAEIAGVGGEGSLENLTLKNRATAATETVPARAVFVMIGADPHTEWLAGTLQRDANGFILTGPGVDLRDASWNLDRKPSRLETSLPGVFAAGDVRHGSVKRFASAVGEGSVAVQYVHDYLAGRQSFGTALNIALPLGRV